MKLGKVLTLCLLSLAFARGALAADLLAVMRADPSLSTFVSLVDKAGLDSQFTGSQKVTVLAPTNGAFDSVGPSEMRGLEGNREGLRAFVLSHVLAGERVATPGSTEHTTFSVRTLSGRNIEIEFTGAGSGRIDNRIRVVRTNIRADNGIIHTIDLPVGAR
jgi:uncharacterized surface protein with fasciclin (FAS1) repeats